MTVVAPIALALSKETRPMGPAPVISTVEPNFTSALLQACTPTERGSRRAPSSRET